MRSRQPGIFGFARIVWRIVIICVAFFVCNVPSALAVPSITAHPNPVKVPSGQTQATTTVTWNAEGSPGFLWISIDGAAETLIAADILKGSIELNVVLGRTYELRLYSAGRERILASAKVTVIEDPSLNKKSLKNPQNQLTDDFNLKRTDEGFLLSQRPKELRCRGSADLRVQFNSDYIIYFAFVRSARPVDPAGRNLAPGECGWTDRPMNLNDRNSLIQATNKTKGEVYRSDAPIPQSERFPDFDEINNVLRDPDRYWTFFVRLRRGEYMFSEYSRQWIPIRSSTIKTGPRITRP